MTKGIQQYLDLPTKVLLEKFGEGRHIPGSGSATALSALLATELMITVCKLTQRKEGYAKVHKDFEFIQNQIETIYKPKLIDLFNNDIYVFGEVSNIRVKRDEEINPIEKRKLSILATEKLKEATELPLEISKTCLKLTEYALSIFDNGFKSAQGDSGVALSNLLSAISGSLFISFLNLKTASKNTKSRWLTDVRKEAEDLAIQYGKIHKEAIRRIINLYSEGLPDDYVQTSLELE